MSQFSRQVAGMTTVPPQYERVMLAGFAPASVLPTHHHRGGGNQ